MPRKALHRCLALALLCLLPAGCSVTGRTPSPTPTPSNDIPIPFETLATNMNTIPDELLGSAPVLDIMPELTYDELEYLFSERGRWLALVAAPQEAVHLYKYLAPEQQGLLASLDYSRDVALILFTGGSRYMFIDRIGFRYGELAVHATAQRYTTGRPEDAYPSQIVRVRRADVPGELWGGTPLNLTMTPQIMEQ